MLLNARIMTAFLKDQKWIPPRISLLFGEELKKSLYN
jgi:hypothetical protein